MRLTCSLSMIEMSLTCVSESSRLQVACVAMFFKPGMASQRLYTAITIIILLRRSSSYIGTIRLLRRW